MRSTAGLTPVGLGKPTEVDSVALSPKRLQHAAAQGFWTWAIISLGTHNARIRASTDIAFHLESLFHRCWKDRGDHQPPRNPQMPRVWPDASARAAPRWLDRLAPEAFGVGSSAQTSGCRVSGLGDRSQPPPKGASNGPGGGDCLTRKGSEPSRRVNAL